MDPVTLTLAEIEALACRALTGSGTSPPNAASVAVSMMAAERDGLPNVGLSYLPTYCEHVLCGKVDGRARPTMTNPRAGAVRVDAATGFAHPAIDLGLPVLADAAHRNGIAALAVTDSYACGVVGFHVERIAEQGLVALAFANASPSIAPWGGRTPFFGTNPIAFAAPRRASPPLVIDQSSSVVAKVAVIERARQGAPVPDGWALDAAGRPTNDPDAAMAGSMAPAGGYKGAGLALMVDILAAGIVGARWSHEASSFGDNEGGPPRVGQLFIAIDPAGFGHDGFADRIEGLFAAMLAQEGVRLPGDRRLAARQAALRDGVAVPAALVHRLETYAAGR